jgi:hypothetical protein
LSVSTVKTSVYSVTGTLSAVNMQDFAGHEAGGFQKHHSVDDILNLAHATQRMELRERLIRLRRMPGCLDHAGRDRVHANSAFGVFDRERLCDRVEAPFGQRCESGRAPRIRMIDQAGRDVDDMAGALLRHGRDRGLRDMEEAGKVDGQRLAEVGFRVVREFLADKYAGIVHKRVNSAEAVKASLDQLFAVSGLAMSPGTASTSASFEALIEREFATTR